MGRDTGGARLRADVFDAVAGPFRPWPALVDGYAAYEIGSAAHRRATAAVGGTVALGIALVVLAASVVADAGAGQKLVGIGVGVVSAAFGVFLRRYRRPLPFALLDTMVVFAAAVLAWSGHHGTVISPAEPFLYLVLGSATSVQRQRSSVYLNTVIIGASYAVALLGDRSQPLPLLRWVLVMTATVGCGLLLQRLMERRRRLAVSERDARARTDAALVELELQNSAKSTFLRQISHELRTPLNAVIGFADVLREELAGPLTPGQRDHVLDIRKAGHHLLEIVDGLLDLAKVESGRIELDRAPVDLADLLGDSIRMVQHTASERQVGLRLAVPPLGTVLADGRKVQQAVVNLLVNAVKFTPPGGTVTLAAERTRSRVSVQVTDTGPGVAAEHHRLIFGRYQQVGGAEGTGLGLYLARRFVELHGGRIWVTSELGAGSTFAFELPVEDGRPTRASTRTRPVRGAGGALDDLTAGRRGLVGLVEATAVAVTALTALLILRVDALRDVAPVALSWVVVSGFVRHRAPRGLAQLLAVLAVYVGASTLGPGGGLRALVAPVSLLALQGGIVSTVSWQLRDAAGQERAARRRAEEVIADLAAVSRHKSDFVASMSHELRTPLNAIIGFAELVGETGGDTLNDAQREYLREVAFAGRHLLAIVDDVLELAKMDVGRVQLRCAPVDVGSLVERELARARGDAELGPVEVVGRIRPVPPVVADPDRLERLLRGLLDHALGATPDGGTVTVAVARERDGVELRVSDTGEGIPARYHRSVFEPFGQGARAVGDAPARGTGLELALAKGIAELHGGTIRLTSAPGDGATLTCWLPLEAEESSSRMVAGVEEVGPRSVPPPDRGHRAAPQPAG